MRAGLSWHDSEQVDVADARQILQAAFPGRAGSGSGETKTYISLRRKKPRKRT